MWATIYEPELNLMIHSLQNGDIDPVLEALLDLKNDLDGQKIEKAESEKRREFYWGIGERND